MDSSVDLSSMDRKQLVGYMAELGQPAFRAGQVFRWLHQRDAADIGAMTDLPKELRQQLTQQAYVTRPDTVKKQVSTDGTVKLLLALRDGQQVETVLMRYDHGLSVCLSTQAGCAMGCAFCASTVGGKARDLTAGEMVAQVYAAAREAGERVHSVVLMGIGEPLDNYDNVLRFCDIITDKAGYGLSGRALTISTCGILPRIYELAEQKRQLTLSVSLHAATDEKRSAIMPVNRTYPLDDLMAACRHYAEETRRRVTFEYAVIHGENDTDADAQALARLLRGTGAHVNLIPVNPARGARYSATREQATGFMEKLKEKGINATVRRTLGSDIEAACGQLRGSEQRRHGTAAQGDKQ